MKYTSYYLAISRKLEAKRNRLAGSLNNVEHSTTWLKSQITKPHKLWDAMPKQPSQEGLRDYIAKVYSGGIYVQKNRI